MDGEQARQLFTQRSNSKNKISSPNKSSKNKDRHCSWKLKARYICKWNRETSFLFSSISKYWKRKKTMITYSNLIKGQNILFWFFAFILDTFWSSFFGLGFHLCSRNFLFTGGYFNLVSTFFASSLHTNDWLTFALVHHNHTGFIWNTFYTEINWWTFQRRHFTCRTICRQV